MISKLSARLTCKYKQMILLYSATKKKSGIKTDGNIARLSNNDDDDENSTWNGNSTQQM